MKRLINFYFLVILIGCVSELEEMKYPETKQDKITEDIFGKNIEDPYRWLEDFTSKEALAWVEKQNNLTDSLISNNSLFRGLNSLIIDSKPFQKISSDRPRPGNTSYLRNASRSVETDNDPLEIYLSATFFLAYKIKNKGIV